MPDIDYRKILEDLKDSVTGIVKERAQKFLDDNDDAKDFLEARASRLAALGVEYMKASSGEAREGIELQMKVVQQSIRNELSSVAVGAEVEARATFATVLDSAVSVLVKAIPVIVSAI